VSSVGSFFSYVNDARSHEPEDRLLDLLEVKNNYLKEKHCLFEKLRIQKSFDFFGIDRLLM